MSEQVKAAEVMASEVEKLGRAASTEPARTFSSNLARNSGRVPAQSLTLGAEPGGANSSRITTKFCNGNEIMTAWHKMDTIIDNNGDDDGIFSVRKQMLQRRSKPSGPHDPRTRCAMLRHFETREWRPHRASGERYHRGGAPGVCAAITALTARRKKECAMYLSERCKTSADQPV
jgi:hypothetical protein